MGKFHFQREGALAKDDDIVKDIMLRVKSIYGDRFPDSVSIKLEREVRQDWHGSAVYIKGDKKIRNSIAIEYISRGCEVKKVIESAGISRAQVYILRNKLRKKSKV